MAGVIGRLRPPRSLFEVAAWDDATARWADTVLHVASREECEALANRVLAMAPPTREAVTNVYIESEAVGTLRWARNSPIESVDRTNVIVSASIQLLDGRYGTASTNRVDDVGLRAIIESARFLATVNTDTEPPLFPETTPAYLSVHMLSEPALRLDVPARSALGRSMAARCGSQGLLSAGNLAMMARAEFVKNSYGLTAYNPSTQCEYSVTVRNREGTASGWAGVSHDDWTKIDVEAVNERALRKCVDSANPVAIEPGRYTAILEPQAVAQLLSPAFKLENAMRSSADIGAGPYGQRPHGPSKIGLEMIDQRMSVIADPSDPEGQQTPFYRSGARIRRFVWFEQGVLRDLPYDHEEAKRYGDTEALAPSVGFRVTGGMSSVEEMVRATKRGVLVTRFHGPAIIDGSVVMLTGTTRDGLWLIENGKILKPIKNFRFNESPLFAFNNVLDLGMPVRVYGGAAVVAPPVRVQDFNFISLTDAI